ncbi:MAG: hypothetical protein AB7O57_21335 [Hyphomicrobiaceae bacterium]
MARGFDGMTTAHDPKDDPEHIPVEKRLSGDFKSPLEVLAAHALSSEQKRQILEVWLGDLQVQPASGERRRIEADIRAAIATLGETAP